MIDVLQYGGGIDLQKIVDEQARKLQRRVDEATLDKAADTLAGFGYVKVDSKNRWFQLFGTPERTVRTLAAIGNRYPCEESHNGQTCSVNGHRCPFAEALSCRVNRGNPEDSPLLEWLKEES